MPRFPFFLLLMVFSLPLRQSAGEPPKVNFFFPAGAARGQTISVTASGTFKEWPVHAWVDRTGLEIQVEKDKGKLKVAVAADAECGVYWLRLHDKSGASALRPFVVGTLPTMEEQEPNDDPRKPQALGESFVVNGKLSKAGDVDGFSIALKEGQTLVASLQASQVLASPMDGVLQVCNERGIVLAQNDDARGTDPLVVFRAPYGGTFLVRTFAFPKTPNSTIGFAGADTFVYRLTITSGPFLDHTIPMSLAENASTLVLQGWNIPESIATVRVESSKGKNTATVFHPQIAGCVRLPVTSHNIVLASEDASPENPQPIKLPSMITGRIERNDDVDVFSFEAKKGKKLLFRVESSSLGFELDPILQLTDETGKVLARNDDNGKQRDSSLTFTVPSDGEYLVEVSNLDRSSGLRHVYRLTVAEASPDFALTIATGEFLIEPGKPLEIPITIDRRNGFSGEIEIKALGLPNGITAAAVKSLSKGATAKTAKLKLTAANEASGVFQIVGVADGKTRTVRFTIADRNQRHAFPWITAAASDKK